jgi:hypothetical protein
MKYANRSAKKTNIEMGKSACVYTTPKKNAAKIRHRTFRTEYCALRNRTQITIRFANEKSAASSNAVVGRLKAETVWTALLR